jgi:hypothetical protein
MGAEAIMTVSAAVVAFVQLVKWAGLPDKVGPIAVLLFSAAGIYLWVWSEVGMFDRHLAFQYFAGGIAVATSAAGIFGFTRAATGAVTSAKAPPGGGAGQNPTEKP